MKKLFTLASLFVAMMVSSCTYDDSAILRDFNDLRNEFETLKEQMNEQQTLLNALANQLTIVSVEPTVDGYIITFSDNSTLTINHGKDGVDGANGKDGANGVDGKDGAIIGVEWNEDSATFTLADGTTLVIPLDIAEIPEEPETPVIPDTPTVGIEAVDLGLSVKWATCNVGANSPEEYGDYFAWGETSPKEEYTEATYKYCKAIEDAWGEVTYEYEDLGDISGTQYDAASVNWGGSWRMPTISEMQELLNDCTWEKSMLNDVKGYLVTGPNGNSIFLPAADCRSGSSYGGAGTDGRYWGSMPYGYFDSGACLILFKTDCYDLYSGNRFDGHSVRPVSE